MIIKPVLKISLYWLIFLMIIVILLFLFLINRFLVMQKTIAFVDRVDIVWMGYTKQKVVALTFDDGPDPTYTPQVLKILKEYNISATFFIEGSNVYKYPNIVRAEIKAGHTIGNHTYSHPRLSKLSLKDITAEILESDAEIKQIIGKKPSYFRPPYEELTENILTASRNLRKQIILSTLTLENVSTKTPQGKAERILQLVFPGAIILAHDGRLNRSQTVAALPYLIKGLTAKGYRIVPLKTLLLKNPREIKKLPKL